MNQEQSSTRVLSILEEDGVSIEGGALDWVPVRRRLGIRAFGTNAYRAAKAGDQVIEKHNESPGHEELYVVLAGSARITVGDEDFECGPGTAVFIPDPDLIRSGTALEDGTAVLAVGGWPDRAFHPMPWEPIYLAQNAVRDGDWAEAAAVLEREARETRESKFVKYRLACYYARAGDEERALAELEGAIAADPSLRDKAEGEEHFASLRETPGWKALVA